MDPVQIIDRDDLGSLFLLAVTALLTAWVLAGERGRGTARLIAGAAVIAYLAHRWRNKPAKSADQLQEALLRGLVCAGLAYSAARLGLTLLIGLWEALPKVKLAPSAPAWREPAPAEPPPEPVRPPAPEPSQTVPEKTPAERVDELNAAFAAALAGVAVRNELTGGEREALRLQLMDEHAAKVKAITGGV